MADEHKVALIIAVDEYEHEDLQRLASPSADARALAETLGRPDLGDFTVTIVQNQTSGVILGEIEDFFSERRRDDLAVLHFSGHGLKDASGQLHLAGCDTIPSRLISTSVDADKVGLLMRQSRAGRAVLLLDCCYGGAFERGFSARADGSIAIENSFDQKSVGGGRGRVIITASNAVQYAFEGTDLADGREIAPSVFTSAIVEGIRDGAADRDADGWVSLGELYDYVYERVRAQTPHQTPSKWEYGVEGGFVISRSPRRLPKKGQLPEALAELLVHPFAPARVGAVDELARLVDGPDLAMAAAAVDALRLLSDDDSRRIAGLAAAALAQRTLAVEPSGVDFGLLSAGSEPVERTCVLVGPPLVEAATVTVGGLGVRAHLVGRELKIRVDPTTSGSLDGAVQLTSMLGTAEVLIAGVVGLPEQSRVESKTSTTSDTAVAATVMSSGGAPPAAPLPTSSAFSLDQLSAIPESLLSQNPRLADMVNEARSQAIARESATPSAADTTSGHAPPKALVPQPTPDISSGHGPPRAPVPQPIVASIPVPERREDQTRTPNTPSRNGSATPLTVGRGLVAIGALIMFVAMFVPIWVVGEDDTAKTYGATWYEQSFSTALAFVVVLLPLLTLLPLRRAWVAIGLATGCLWYQIQLMVEVWTITSTEDRTLGGGSFVQLVGVIICAAGIVVMLWSLRDIPRLQHKPNLIVAGAGAVLALAGIIGAFLTNQLEYNPDFVYGFPAALLLGALFSVAQSGTGARQRLDSAVAVAVQAVVGSVIVFVEVYDPGPWAYARALSALGVVVGCLLIALPIGRGSTSGSGSGSGSTSGSINASKQISGNNAAQATWGTHTQ